MRKISISSDNIHYFLLIVFLLFVYMKNFKNKKIINISSELVVLLFGIYIIKIISLVWFPILIQFGSNIIVRSPIIWLNPINSWIHIIKNNDIYGILYNIVGNLVLLFPLPIFLIYFYKKKVDSLLKMLIICFLVSLGIESFQYIESILISGVGRFIETNDIILNTTGGVLGYIFYDRCLSKLLNN